MCGIYGVITSPKSLYSNNFLKKTLNELAHLSETRGKDSSGLCSFNQKNNTIEIVRGPKPTKDLLNNNIAIKMIDDAFSNGLNTKYAFGHSRLVTNGSQLNNQNNQPVIKNGIVGVHNGIIANEEELSKNHKSIIRESEIDTEVLLGVLNSEINLNKSLSDIIFDTITKIDGTVASALVFDDLNKLLLITNNGSLYTLHNNNDILFFASEYNMLKSFQKKINLDR